MSPIADSPDGQGEIWTDVLRALANRIGPQAFDTWFRPLEFAGCEAGSLHLSAPNERFRRCFQENYLELLGETVRDVLGEPREVRLSVDPLPEEMKETGPGIPPLPVVHASCLETPSEKQSWLIEGLWTAQAVGCLAGSPKLGKSWLALDMAVSVASATPCLGAFPVHTSGPVLLYAAEDSTAALRFRLESLARTRGLEFRDLDVQVITADSLRLDRADDQDRLQATVVLHHPALLVLDPLIRVHMLDENAATAVAGLLGYFRSLQRKTGVAIALVHHFRKNLSSATAGYRLRGSSDFYAFVDSLLYLQRRREQLTLSAEHRSAPALGPLSLELVGEPHPHFRLLTHQVNLTPPQDPLHIKILELLSNATAPVTADALRFDLKARNQRVLETLRTLCAEKKVTRSAQGYTLAGDHGATRQPSARPA